MRQVLRLFIFTILLCQTKQAVAGPIFVQNRNASTFRPATISLAPLAAKPASQRKIILTLSNSKADRQTLDLDVEAPKGAVLSFYSAMEAPKKVTDLSPRKKKVSPGLLYTITGAGRKKIVFGEAQSGGGSGGGAPGDYICGCLTNSDIQDIIASFRAVGINYSVEEVCRQFTSIPVSGCDVDTPYLNDNANFGNTAAVSAFIRRDACANSGKTPGKAVLEFNLSKVPASVLATAKIVVKPKFSAYSGNKQVKLKKAGDAAGKFAGIPLLLSSPAGAMSFTGSTGEVYLTKYAKSKLTFSKSVKIADYVFYRNLVLWRVPLGGVLSGGQGTFEMRANQAGYSICAKLVRKDQFFNRYPVNSE
jgi:hypothetical protein